MRSSAVKNIYRYSITSSTTLPSKGAHAARSDFDALHPGLRRGWAKRPLHRLPPDIGRDRELEQAHRNPAKGDHGGAPKPAGAAERRPLSEFDWPRLTYLLMALLLATGAGYGFWRFRADRRNAIIGLLVWAGLIALVAALYVIFN